MHRSFASLTNGRDGQRCEVLLTNERKQDHDSSIAGITIPDSRLAVETTEFIRDTESPLLYHHSRRTFLFGMLHGEIRGLKADPELLYVGAMFHDIGLVEGHRNLTRRFEVDGAYAARDFLRPTACPTTPSAESGHPSLCTPLTGSRSSWNRKSLSWQRV
jgi:hypothetical protein